MPEKRENGIFPLSTTEGKKIEDLIMVESTSLDPHHIDVGRMSVIMSNSTAMRWNESHNMAIL